jgi:hypothetical protein
MLHAFLTSAVDESEVLDSRSGRFTSWSRALRNHWTRSSMGSKATLNAKQKINIFLPFHGTERQLLGLPLTVDKLTEVS